MFSVAYFATFNSSDGTDDLQDYPSVKPLVHTISLSLESDQNEQSEEREKQ